jgi:hypothetical protein
MASRTQTVKTLDLQIEGLTELSRVLKGFPPDFRRELRAANKEVAFMEATRAKAAAYALGGVAAHVAPSIKASAGYTSAGVTFGGADYPMAGGAEFGSYQYPQFEPWRGNSSDAGYFVYPTIRRDAEEIEHTYTEAIDRLLNRAFPKGAAA